MSIQSIEESIRKNEQFCIMEEVEFLKRMYKIDDICEKYNTIPAVESAKRKTYIRELFGEVRGDFVVFSPFKCSLGVNISIGNNVMINSGCKFMDLGKIDIGDGVWIGPDCSIYTSGHAVDPKNRKKGMGCAHDIKIEDNVWIGGNVVIACGEKQGLNIGKNSVICAGSVVTRDVPENAMVAGNPAKIIRKLDD